MRHGYSAGVQAQRRMLTMLMWIGRLYLWRWLPGGRRAFFYSINALRAQHPEWFREDLKRLFALLASATIQPRVAERTPSLDGDPQSTSLPSRRRQMFGRSTTSSSEIRSGHARLDRGTGQQSEGASGPP